MKFTITSISFVFLCAKLASSLQINSEAKQDWGYVDVRPNAHMFWWLYWSTSSQPVPLIIWIQGGPGGSSTGYGNFVEIGPLDVSQKPRNTTWLQVSNLLFIDNPVGAGYSYTDTDDAFTTNVDQIATDLISVMKAFFKKQPDFQTMPLYIFSESYGGKMTAAFSQKLLQSIKSGEIKSDFKGFALGDSWISPEDSTLSWGSYLYHTSLVDDTGLEKLNEAGRKLSDMIRQGKYTDATSQWNVMEGIVEAETDGVNFYNILTNDEPGSRRKATSKQGGLYNKFVQVYANDDLAALMNGPIKQKLNIPQNVTWGAQSPKVFQYQTGDFMKPVINIVDDLITNSSLKVVVYSGQLDLIVDTVGTETWVKKLTWPGLSSWNTSRFDPVMAKGMRQAFVKEYKNFSFYWILKAGHMVPFDNGDTALEMVKRIIKP